MSSPRMLSELLVRIETPAVVTISTSRAEESTDGALTKASIGAMSMGTIGTMLTVLVDMA